MSLNSKSIGMRVKQYRLERNYSQEELARKVFSSREHISRIEAGEKLPGLETIVLIANALGASVNDLLTDDLTVLTSDSQKFYYEVFFDCNSMERTILMKSLDALKKILRESNI